MDGLQVRQIFNFMVGRNYSGDEDRVDDKADDGGRDSVGEKYFRS